MAFEPETRALRSSFGRAAALSVLLLSSCAAFSHAFTPTTLLGGANSIAPSTASAGAFIAPSPVNKKAMLAPSRSSLQMNFVSDFITEKDLERRLKDNDKYIAELQKRVDNISALEPDIEDLGDDELAAKTKEFRERLAKGEDINGKILEESFAVVREAAW
jgi:hypothetical protein